MSRAREYEERVEVDHPVYAGCGPSEVDQRLLIRRENYFISGVTVVDLYM